MRSSVWIAVLLAPRALSRSLRKRAFNLRLDDPAWHHVARAGEGNDRLELLSLGSGSNRSDQVRLFRRTMCHEPRPCMEVVGLREHPAARHSEYLMSMEVDRMHETCGRASIDPSQSRNDIRMGKRL